MSFDLAVESYSVAHYFRATATNALVRLTCSDGWTVHIEFIDKPKLPVKVNAANRLVYIHEHAVHFQRVLDLLRNEGPLRVAIEDEAAPVRVHIWAGPEPVGEAES